MQPQNGHCTQTPTAATDTQTAGPQGLRGTGARRICMCACMHACMFAWMLACLHACMQVCMYVCVYVCRYGYVCMHACMPAHLPSQLSQCPQAPFPEKARLPTSVQLPGGASKTSALSAPCSTKDKVGRTSSTPSSCANPRCETPSNSRRPCPSIECTSSHDLDTHAG